MDGRLSTSLDCAAIREAMLDENKHSWDARLAAVLWGVIWLAIAGGLAWLAALHLKDVVSLATSGIETTAVVADYDPIECGGRKRRHICNDHTIVASEFGSKVIDLGYPVAVGSRIVVTYDPGNKANVRAGGKPTFETLEFLDWVSLVALAFGVLMSTGSVVQIAAATLGLERFRRPKTNARSSRSEASANRIARQTRPLAQTVLRNQMQRAWPIKQTTAQSKRSTAGQLFKALKRTPTQMHCRSSKPALQALRVTRSSLPRSSNT